MAHKPTPYELADPTDEVDHGLHPVDSRIRHCCGGIGDHTADCCRKRPDGDQIRIPVGATRAEPLDRDGRLFYGATDVTIEASGWLSEDVRVETGGLQSVDGSHEWQIWAGPIHPDSPITAVQARRIGEALIAAADELDRINAGAVARWLS